MRNWRYLTCTVAASLLLVPAALAQAPLSAVFTYQGQLKDIGGPANGSYNLTFTLWDAVAGGSQIGLADSNPGTLVTDGLFTVELNDTGQFGGSAFTGDARWLQISVNGTPLSPRQPLSAAPYALFALDGPGAPGFWSASGAAISNTNTGFVGIKRSTAVSAAEFFGIQAPVNSGYGGMYIRTDGTAALPFYGYRAGASGETAWTYLDGASGDYRINVDGDRVTVTDTGDVGIGVTAPAARLDISDNSTTPALRVANSGTGPGVRVQSGADMLDISMNSINSEGDGFFGDPLYLNDVSNQPVIIGVNGGNCGIGGATSGLPVVKLHVDGGGDANLASITSGYFVIGAPNGPNIVMDNNEIMARNDSAASTLFLNHQGGDVHIGQGGGTSTLFAPVVAITGADVAEKFAVSGDREAAQPGTVMEIDPENAGKLRIARGAYNRRVAGIVSGAGDIPVGAILGNLPGFEDAPAIALSGRVWVQCDASGGAIQPGDLLTTSDAAGHAMKANDYPRAQGAIIGKAMSALDAGQTGLVLVLVNLQ